MNPQQIPDSLLAEIVSGERSYEFESLAVKMLLSRFRIELILNPGPETLKAGVAKLRELLSKSKNMPSVHNDLKKLVS